MDEDLHNIEDLFYSALNDNEETPSTNVWDSVERQLDRDKIATIKKKYTQLKRITAVLFLFLIIAIFTIYDISNQINSRPGNNPGNLFKQSVSRHDVTIRELDNPGKNNSLLVDAAVSSKESGASFDPITKEHDLKSAIPCQNDLNTGKDIPALLKRSQAFERSSKVLSNTKQGEAEALAKVKVTCDVFSSPFLLNNIQNSVSEMGMSSATDSITFQPLTKWQVVRSVEKKHNKKGGGILSVPAKEIASSRVSLTAFFSPDVAWYRLQDDNTSNPYANASEIESNEKHGFSSDYGLLINFRLNKNWSLESGLSINNTNINSEPEVIYAGPDNAGTIKYRINTSSGYGFILPSFSSNPAIGDSLSVITLTHSLHYLSLPVNVSYDVKKGKYFISLKTGMSVNFLTGSKLKTAVENGNSESVETVNNILGVKKTYLNGLAGISVAYKFTSRLSLVIAPTIHFALNSINRNAGVKSYPMYFGPAIGLKMGL